MGLNLGMTTTKVQVYWRINFASGLGLAGSPFLYDFIAITSILILLILVTKSLR